ncbi:MAG: hypothetical protein EZS28_041656, partial [Streblomastix strix]
LLNQEASIEPFCLILVDSLNHTMIFGISPILNVSYFHHLSKSNPLFDPQSYCNYYSLDLAPNSTQIGNQFVLSFICIFVEPDSTLIGESIRHSASIGTGFAVYTGFGWVLGQIKSVHFLIRIAFAIVGPHQRFTNLKDSRHESNLV